MSVVTIALPEIRVGRSAVTVAAGVPVLLCRSANRLYAFAAVCPHQRKSMDGARISGDTIVCPWHGAAFALADGAPRSPLTRRSLPVYACAESDGEVTLTID